MRSKSEPVDVPEELRGVLAFHLRESCHARYEREVKASPQRRAAVGLWKVHSSYPNTKAQGL